MKDDLLEVLERVEHQYGARTVFFGLTGVFVVELLGIIAILHLP